MARKLYINVEQVKINGDPQELCRYVKETDFFVQEVTGETVNLANILNRYYQIDNTDQFKKIVVNVNEMAKLLIQESEEMLGLKNDLVIFISNMFSFDDRNDSVSHGMRHVGGVKIVQPDNRQVFHFTRDDYIYVQKSLVRYIDGVNNASRLIKRDVDAAGSFWIDPQYQIFSNTVDEILHIIKRGTDGLSDYASHLNQKINILGNR